MDRREFLRSGMAVGSVALGGCVDGLSGSLSTGAGWPPGQPITPPDEAPELPPPTWGDPEAPTAFVYNDMATRQAGRVFDREWKGLLDPIQEGRVQVSFCDYPLPRNEWSYPIAITARSVQYHAGQDAFLEFAQEILEDYSPYPYFTKQRVLDAVESAGAPREAVREDTESWRFYPVVEESRKLAERRGIENSVSRSVIVHNGERSRPVLTSWQHIPPKADEMSQQNPDDP